jgi:hypothetical protein
MHHERHGAVICQHHDELQRPAATISAQHEHATLGPFGTMDQRNDDLRRAERLQRPLPADAVSTRRLREPNLARLNMSDEMRRIKSFTFHGAMIAGGASREARASSRLRNGGVTIARRAARPYDAR